MAISVGGIIESNLSLIPPNPLQSYLFITTPFLYDMPSDLQYIREEKKEKEVIIQEQQEQLH
jgi:hypothetical protein